jgi:hypothetical protein
MAVLGHAKIEQGNFFLTIAFVEEKGEACADGSKAYESELTMQQLWLRQQRLCTI